MLKKLLAAALALFAAAAFAAVDANTATQAELEAVKGIGPATASKIMDERKKGIFKDWKDLIARVKGVGEHNSAKFSESGLTVNGTPYTGMPAKTAATKPTAATATAKPEAKDYTGAPAKTAATAPAAADTKTAAAPAPSPTTTTTPVAGGASKPKMTKEEKAAAKAEKAAAKKAAKEAKEAKPAAAAAASAPASAAKK